MTDETQGERTLLIWEASNLLCHMQRHPSLGHWCGYVHLPEGHPWHGKTSDMIHDECPDLSVHGGLSFAIDGDMKDWVIGFDCAHAGDLVPGLDMFEPVSSNGVYRTQAWVKEETERLAAQAWDAVVREIHAVRTNISAMLSTKH